MQRVRDRDIERDGRTQNESEMRAIDDDREGLRERCDNDISFKQKTLLLCTYYSLPLSETRKQSVSHLLRSLSIPPHSSCFRHPFGSFTSPSLPLWVPTPSVLLPAASPIFLCSILDPSLLLYCSFPAPSLSLLPVPSSPPPSLLHLPPSHLLHSSFTKFSLILTSFSSPSLTSLPLRKSLPVPAVQSTCSFLLIPSTSLPAHSFQLPYSSFLLLHPPSASLRLLPPPYSFFLLLPPPFCSFLLLTHPSSSFLLLGLAVVIMRF